jgi:hypothetical protein
LKERHVQFKDAVVYSALSREKLPMTALIPLQGGYLDYADLEGHRQAEAQLASIIENRNLPCAMLSKKLRGK